jgi:hypothetical protein
MALAGCNQLLSVKVLRSWVTAFSGMGRMGQAHWAPEAFFAHLQDHCSAFQHNCCTFAALWQRISSALCSTFAGHLQHICRASAAPSQLSCALAHGVFVATRADSLWRSAGVTAPSAGGYCCCACALVLLYCCTLNKILLTQLMTQVFACHCCQYYGLWCHHCVCLR